MTKQSSTPALARMLPVLFFAMTPGLSYADLVVIANKALAADSVTLEQARKLWLGKLRKLPGTGKLVVIDQADGNPAHTTFYRKVVKKKPAQLKAYWAKISFTGKGFPPEQLDSDAAVLEWVAAHPNGLGYVDSAAVNDAVKALLTVK